MTFVLEACDVGDGNGEDSVQGNQPATTMRPLSPDSPWDSHRDGVLEVLTMDHGSPEPVQSHSYEISPYQPATINHPISPTIEGPPTLSLREASLMRSFIQQIAPWVRGVLSCLQEFVT